MIGPGGSRPDQGDEAHAKMTGTFWALRGKRCDWRGACSKREGGVRAGSLGLSWAERCQSSRIMRDAKKENKRGQESKREGGEIGGNGDPDLGHQDYGLRSQARCMA
ncbi:hypothetical protein BO85DRAFT_197713 [Aspergillus piperis CBS 112811]|uniref:Uncharacterized protein n=1 Tax=Aspergillus piperis CBS 112811 TaxID=1448313 RepID=A0A8G1VHT0_9EURO|nr:hypothetical protein BO85DRAFT_197713 [Aspergillus piperis CBS 112811]RAH52537.1 hypothetical protein BO85DRAFT_197713 [Aspergillus piperis CBS 112811]